MAGDFDGSCRASQKLFQNKYNKSLTIIIIDNIAILLLLSVVDRKLKGTRMMRQLTDLKRASCGPFDIPDYFQNVKEAKMAKSLVER